MKLIKPECYGSELLNKRISKFEGIHKPGPVSSTGKRLKIKNMTKRTKEKTDKPEK